jgi:hypothetical protein
MKQTLTLLGCMALNTLLFAQKSDTTAIHAALGKGLVTQVAESSAEQPTLTSAFPSEVPAPDFVGRCNNLPTLSCGGFVSGSTSGSNSFNASDYKLPFGGDYNGPDKAYSVTVAAQTSARFILDILSAGNDLDLILLKQCGDQSSQVVLSGYSLEKNTVTGYYREVLDLNLLPGTYTLVVDGKFADQFGNFKVTMNCTCTCIEPFYDLPYGTKLLCDNFQDYQINKALTPQSSRWGLFNHDPYQDNNRDATVRSEAGGNQYAQVNYYIDPSGAGNDRIANVLYQMDNRTSGRYRVSWRTWIEPNKGGLYYGLHRNADSLGNDAQMKIAYAVFFSPGGVGNLLTFPDPANTNGSASPFTYAVNAWNDVVNIIDIDADVAELWINDNFVYRWKFSLTKGDGTMFKRLESFLFTGGKTTAGIIQDYRVDDICVWQTTAPCTPTGSGSKVCIENKIDKIPEGTARCKLYTSDEWDECQSACEYGGTFAYRGVTYRDTLYPADLAPAFIKNDPCVVSAYGASMPQPLYADVYIFKKADKLDLDVLLTNSHSSCKAFVFSCYYKSGNTCIAGQKCLTDAGGSAGYLPLTCDSIYYIVVTGGNGSKYNMNIVPEGRCPSFATETLNIGCTSPSSIGLFKTNGTVSTSQVHPDLQANAAYAKRYAGVRPYTGGEQIYKLTLRNPALVEFRLIAKDPMGMFLFTAFCGNECEKAVENTPGNDTVTFLRLLLANDYYLIVDKATLGGNHDFELQVSCIATTTNNVIPYKILNCTNFGPPLEEAKGIIVPDEYCGCSGTIADPDTSHYIKIKNDAYAFSPTHEVFFLVRDKKTHDFTSSSVMYQNANQIVASAQGKEIWADRLSDTLQCSYATGDTFFYMIVNKGDGNQNYRFVRPIYEPGTSPNANVDTFRLKGGSNVNKFVSTGGLNAVFFTTDKSGLDPLAKDTNFTFTFYSSIPWRAKLFPDRPSWVTALSPSSTVGGNVFTQDVTLSFSKNPNPKPRRTLLKFASAAYPEYVYLYLPVEQDADCIFTPIVSIESSASAVCKGDTLRLKAVVRDGTKDISDAFIYKWGNGKKGQSFRDTLNTVVPGGQPYAVTVTGQYCKEASTSTSTTVIVRDLPPAPTPIAGSTDRTACLGSSAALTLTNNAPALASIQWFDSPSGTEVKFTGNAYTPPPPGQPGAYTFYAQAKYTSGTPQCASARVPATLTIRALPNFTVKDKKCAPELETTYSFKVNTAAGYTVTVVSGTGNVSNSGNGQFSINGIPKNTNLTFRVRDNSPQGCFRDSTVTGLPCNCQAPPKPIPQTVAPVCAGGTATLQVSLPPGAHYTVEWFDQEAPGSLAVKKNSSAYTTSVLKTYWAETFDTLSKCRSTERTEMKITVNELPPLDIIGTECEADFDHYTLIVKRVAGISLSLSPAVGNPPVLTADRISISRIPEGTDLVLTATNALTGCFSTKNLKSPECGCPIVDPPSGVPAAQTYCAGQPILPIEVMVKTNETADWLSADGDTLLLNSTVFTPANSSATYFVRARNILSNCFSVSRPVAITVHPLPSVVLSPPVCNPNLLNYSVEFSSPDGLPPALPNLFANGAGGFLVDNIQNGQGLSFVLTNPLTGCSRTVQVAAPVCNCASLAPLAAPVFVKNEAYCQGDTSLPALRVKVAVGETADWYNATGGLEKLGDTLFVPPAKGTYFAARRNLTSDCASAGRTAVIWAENPLPLINVTRKDCAPDLLTYEISLTANADLLTANWGNPTGAMPSFKVTGIPRDSAVTVTATIAATGCANSQQVSPKQCNCAAFPVNQPSALGLNPVVVCANAALPLLTVNVAAGETATWYDSLGNVLASDTLRYLPKSGGVFLVESRNRQTGCLSDTRLAYRLTVNPIPALEVILDTCNQTLDRYTLYVKTNGKLSQPSPYVAINNNDGTYAIPDVDLGVTLQLLSTFTATSCKAQLTYKKEECPCPPLAPPQSLGDAEVCKGAATLPLLAVEVNDPNLETVDWYNAAGTLVKANSLTYQPTVAATATYFAQTRYKFSGECVNANRTPVTLSVFEPVMLQTGGNQKVCEGEAVVLNGSISGGISTGFWSAPVGSFSPSASTLNATYQPPAGVSSVTLTLTSGDPVGPCSALSGQMTVEVKPRPTFEEKSKKCAPNLLTYNVDFLVPPTAQPSINLPIIPQFLGSGLYRVSGIPRDSNLRVAVLDPDSKCSAVFDVITDNCPCSIIALPSMPNNPVICPEQSIPYLTVVVPTGQTVNWYSETGTLLKADTIAYRPSAEGTYFAEAREKVSGCTSQGRTPVTLTVKPSPMADAGDSTAICPGKSATLSAVGAFDTYLWSNGATTPSATVSPTTTQFYWLTVTQDGCSDTDSVKVKVRPEVMGSIELSLPIKCFGDANGEIRAIATGGTGMYKVLWSTMSAAPKLSNLTAGIYTVTISDSPGCTDVATYELSQPTPLAVVSSTIQNESAAGMDGSVSVTVGGGTPQYSYQWSDAGLFEIPGATLDFLGGQKAGWYFIKIMDVNGCSLLDSFEIKKTSTGLPLLPDDWHAWAHLFPNPTDGRLSLRLQLPQTLPVSVQLLDALGRVVQATDPVPLSEHTLDFDLSQQPAGLYIMRLQLGDNVLTKKLLVQK